MSANMDCTHVLSYDCLSGLLQGGVTPPRPALTLLENIILRYSQFANLLPFCYTDSQL